MGHIIPKDVYKSLGDKLDSLHSRTPINKHLFEILKELYTEEEAEVVVSIPYGPEKIEKVAKVCKMEFAKLQKILDSLASKGLVMDFYLGDDYYYMPSPMLIGIFEFTMMRTKGKLDYKTWSNLFSAYLSGNSEFFDTNFGDGQTITLLRSVPHEDTIAEYDHTEILDYEKAHHIIDSNKKFAKGICSCRHEKHHLDKKDCDIPLETCSAFAHAADFWIRNDLAKEVSKEEMHETIEMSRELGLVMCVDNVKRNPISICHCCKCCCHALAGITEFGYANVIVSSNYFASVEKDRCNGCSICEKKCPTNAIKMIADEDDKKKPQFDEVFCLGCGVCSLKCNKNAIQLKKRKKRIIHPETTFQRVILSSLERGTLQNQIFTNPRSLSQKFMRIFLGAFFRLDPVKRALLSDTLRSRFLRFMESGARIQGKSKIVDL